MNIKETKNISTPNERVEKALKLAHQGQPFLNAVVTFVDPEKQLENLRNINPEAAFYGIPIVLKDNVNMKSVKTTAGSHILANYVSQYNATITDRLQAAGAIVIAKSSMDELGMGGTNLTAATGPVYNPYDLSRMSGGSSGGSAVLVASGVVPFAIGTDTGDSVRKPASFNGIIGVKPSYGRISRYGIIPYASSLDHVGYFTRNVADAALALEVLAGRDDQDMTSSFREVEKYSADLSGDLSHHKIGYIANVVRAIENQEVLSMFNSLIEKIKSAGAEVVPIEMNEDLLNAILPTYYIIANSEATANHSNLDGLRFGVQQAGNDIEEIMSASRTAGFGKLIRKRFVIGSFSLFVENQEKLFRKAQKVRRLIVEDLYRALNGVDGLLAPASSYGAPKLQDNSLDQLSSRYLIAENFMVISNFSGTPSLTQPLGYVDGLPVGINLICHPFEEKKMFEIAAGLEKMTGLADCIREVGE